MSDFPFDGSCDHKDIRTFYRDELAYLRAIQKRFACAICGDKANECLSCRNTRERIEEREHAAQEKAMVIESPMRSLLAERR